MGLSVSSLFVTPLLHCSGGAVEARGRFWMVPFLSKIKSPNCAITVITVVVSCIF